MFYSSALLVLIIQFVSAIVVSKGQNDAATIPTELFKPLQPQANTERTTSNSQLTLPQGNPSRNELPQGNFGGNDFDKFFNLGDMGNSDIKYKVLTTSDNDFHPILTQQQGPIQRTFRIQSPTITQRWSSGPDLSDFDTSTGNGYYKVSSKSSFYDSSSMNEPVVRHYEYDSRNGGTPQSLDSLFSLNE